MIDFGSNRVFDIPIYEQLTLQAPTMIKHIFLGFFATAGGGLRRVWFNLTRPKTAGLPLRRADLTFELPATDRMGLCYSTQGIPRTLQSAVKDERAAASEEDKLAEKTICCTSRWISVTTPWYEALFEGATQSLPTQSGFRCCPTCQ